MDFLQLIKLKHWIKNILIIIPIITSHQLFLLKEIHTYYIVIIFCLISSVVYYINNFVDYERDTKNKLKECGLSTNKLATIIEIANQEENEGLENRKGFEIMSDIQIIQKLTKIKGIGEWTAQMLMIFNLGKLDIFPVGDFALKKNYSLFKNISSPINMKDLSKISEEWKPFRSIAAWYLWKYKLKSC